MLTLHWSWLIHTVFCPLSLMEELVPYQFLVVPPKRFRSGLDHHCFCVNCLSLATNERWLDLIAKNFFTHDLSWLLKHGPCRVALPPTSSFRRHLNWDVLESSASNSNSALSSSDGDVGVSLCSGLIWSSGEDKHLCVCLVLSRKFSGHSCFFH